MRAQTDGRHYIRIEYELIPLLEEMRINFYFWGCVYPDKDRMKNYYENEIKQYSGNAYIAYSEKKRNISYELILVNHGSSDGTKEYFESIHPDKQLDIKVNGGGLSAAIRIVEGKYMLQISNDVIIGDHAIDNLYRCMESDKSIAWAVPTTPNICNVQSIRLPYDNLEDFERMVRENNQTDPYRWEQRARLCNPIDIRRSSVFDEMNIYMDIYIPRTTLHFRTIRYLYSAGEKGTN